MGLSPAGVYRSASGGAQELSLTRRWMGSSPGVGLYVVSTGGLLITSVMIFIGSPFVELGVVCLLLGLSFAYIVAAFVLNETRVDLKAGRLRVSHGPIPWFGRRDLEATAVEQIFCEWHPATGRHHTTDHFSVQALLRGRTTPLELVGNLHLASQAMFIEETLERALGIEDAPVKGELPFKRVPTSSGESRGTR